MSIYHFFIAAIGRRSFCKSVPWAGLRQRDGEWGQKLAFILGSACKRVAGTGAASNERVARRFPSRREARIGRHFACASRSRRQNSDSSTQCNRSRDRTAGAAVESLRLADDPELSPPGSRLGDLCHAAFRHCHGQQRASVQLATMAATGEDAA